MTYFMNIQTGNEVKVSRNFRIRTDNETLFRSLMSENMPCQFKGKDKVEAPKKLIEDLCALANIDLVKSDFLIRPLLDSIMSQDTELSSSVCGSHAYCMLHEFTGYAVEIQHEGHFKIFIDGVERYKSHYFED